MMRVNLRASDEEPKVLPIQILIFKRFSRIGGETYLARLRKSYGIPYV